MVQRSTILAAAALLMLQVAGIVRLGGQTSGAVLSDLVQLGLGILCVFASRNVFLRSDSAGRSYWKCVAVTFGVWALAQALGTYVDATSNHSLDPLEALLFFFSGVPFGMLLFLDPDHEGRRFDRLHLLDFLQVCAFWVSVYLYFSQDPNISQTTIGWGRFGWSTSLVFNGVLAVSFVLRAFLAKSAEKKTFFPAMALFLFLSGLADSYASYVPNQVTTGSRFDLVWSALLSIPLLAAATWNHTKSPVAVPQSRAQRIVINEFFPLVYPFFSLLLVTQIAQRERVLSSCIGAVIFVAVGARVLIIQRRLVRTQDSLEFEATHDALTGLWNRCAILECLDKEVERQKRNGDPVGLIMADADRFKNINDTYGHPVGDQVLSEVARRLTGALRSYDWVGRYGGEEFLIIVPNCSGRDTFNSAERLRQTVAHAPIATSAGPISVTLSMGLISTTGCAPDLTGALLLRMADEALYRAKANGRNRVEGAYLWSGEPAQPIAAPSIRRGSELTQ
jgi:diguanylate cyclase (GGDEF)-like protein